LFNGISLENSSLPHTRLFYGYYVRVRNPYGVQWQTRVNAFNARYEALSWARVAGYAYLQDQARTGSLTGFSDNSNSIAGVRAWGTFDISSAAALFYGAELAEQRSFADGDPRIHAPYRRLGAGLRGTRMALRVEWERLGSNAGAYGFQTPLGSTQLFTGRSDVFATTPMVGLRDLRAALTGQVASTAFRFEFHKFRSDVQDIDLGHEWDAGRTYELLPRLTLSADYADYQVSNHAQGFSSTRKAWVSLRYAF